MRWHLAWRADPLARELADRHYNRQSIGADPFVPPGRCMVLLIPGAAFWVTSWPLPEFVKHRWAGAWVCSAFRNERRDLYRSSDLIREAVAATRWYCVNEWRVPEPELGMVSFIDEDKIRRKRDPGRCYLKAGFVRLSERTATEGLAVVQQLPSAMPPPHCAPWRAARARLRPRRSMKALRAPFPWFGGKSRAAHLVWPAFGDVPNYVEPFAGSLAVLLARPTQPRIETVNDIDCYLSNFWRAVTEAPAEVAGFADWPVNEADLHARHRWLVNQAEFRDRMKQDPDFFDAKVAGWWVWGLCQWIGSGWCASPEWWKAAHEGNDLGKGRRPHLRGQGINAKPPVEWTGRSNAGRAARGILTAGYAQRPDLTAARGVLGAEAGFEKTRPHLGPERGVQKRARDLTGSAGWGKRPQLGKGGRGVVREQLPSLGGSRGAAGKGVNASAKSVDAIAAWMVALQERLRRVRVCCGDWTRILGRSPTECIGVTGVFLDPPYSDAAGRDGRLYNHDDLSIAHAVREWALEHGDNPKLRIALCGYEGEHPMPESWQCVAWKANGGYASSAGHHENAHRERIWFSPACLPVHERQASLFTKERTA